MKKIKLSKEPTELNDTIYRDRTTGKQVRVGRKTMHYPAGDKEEIAVLRVKDQWAYYMKREDLLTEEEWLKQKK
jgi:hypothetical protein